MSKIIARPLPFRAGEKEGYIDVEGNVIHKATFDIAGNFNDGLGHVSRERWKDLSIVNEDFKVLGEVNNVYSIDKFSCGFLVVTKAPGDKSADQYFFVDREGRNQFGRMYEHVRSFSEDRAFVKSGGKWGMIDLAGRWVVEPRFLTAWPFERACRVTSVEVAEKAWRLIDVDGKFVSDATFDELQTVSEGRVAFGRRGPDGIMKYGFADDHGREVVPPIFENVQGGFQEGLVGVEVEDETWGVVDRSGHWVIHPQYTFIGDCSDGLLSAYKGGGRDLDRGLLGGKFGYVRPDGSVAIDFQFDGAFEFDGGIASVAWDRKAPDEDDPYNTLDGYVDLNGRIIWREKEE
jgi:hypothetical protein